MSSIAGNKLPGLIRHHAQHERVPDQFEQDEAHEHCCSRSIHKPKTNAFTLARWTVFIVLLAAMSSLATYLALSWLGYVDILPLESSGTMRFFWFFFLIFTVLYFKKLLILFVELYQRYAPEDVRRRCMFKPTCSEYAILALEKYHTRIAVFKIFDRLFRRCKGLYYRIDYP